MVVSPLLYSVGSGLLYTLHIGSPHSKLIGYQILSGIGIGKSTFNFPRSLYLPRTFEICRWCVTATRNFNTGDNSLHFLHCFSLKSLVIMAGRVCKRRGNDPSSNRLLQLRRAARRNHWACVSLSCQCSPRVNSSTLWLTFLF